MPVSDANIRQMVVDHIIENVKPKLVFDLGCGYGLYGTMLKERDPQIVLIGLDIWLPYFDKIAGGVYTALIYGNVESILTGSIRPWGDLILCMDLIEHLDKETAERLICWLWHYYGKVIISTPLFNYPQGAWGGNPYETHRCQFTQEELESFNFRLLCSAEAQTPDGKQHGRIGAFKK